MDDELVCEFIEESKTALADIESDLLALESSSTLDSDCVNRVFRAIHTIKGASSFLKLEQITNVSHRAESLLSHIREGSASPTQANVGIILKSVDTLTSMLDADDLGQEYPVAELLDQLEQAIKLVEEDSGKDTSVPPEERNTIQPSTSDVAACSSASTPSSTSTPASTSNPAQPEAADRNQDAPAPTAPSDTPEPHAETAPSAAGPSPGAKKGSTTSGRITDPTTRVPTSVLSHLLQTTGEMVMSRNQLLNSQHGVEDQTLEQLSRLISEVHETVLKTRKGTTGTLFNRFHRIVRDLTLSLGKQAQLFIEGGELELDRSIIDAFTDPLTHLIRNCVDHALEMPDEREANGKPRSGSIHLRSSLQSGEIVIEIEDDGRGIDAEMVRRKAVDKGVITAEEAAKLDSQQSIELIFAAGFSTKEAATDLSGRGVGMDVVRTNIEDIGGVLTIESEKGRGTRISAHLPLAKALVTSSLTRTLIVGVGQNRFAIPDSAVCEIIRPDTDNYPRDFRTLEHGEVFHLRGEILPLIHLSDALGHPRLIYCPTAGDYVRDQRPTLSSADRGRENANSATTAPPDVVVVVIRHRQHRFALIVNDVYGIREAIVQPVPRLLEHCSLYTGHAVMGDGRCVFILDIGNIAKRNRLQFDMQPQAPKVEEDAIRSTAKERILIFNYANDEYFAVPLEIASLVLSTDRSQFRQVGNKTYYPCQDKMLSIIYLDHYLRVKPLKENPYPENLILPADINADIAIACGSEIRISELGSCFQSRGDADSCSIALFEEENKLVTLLDLYRLLEMHSPDNHHPVTGVGSANILCVDDSVFFRGLIARYLEQTNWHITFAENGRQAWDLLNTQVEDFDLIISDINMPEMNGFELGEKIRGDRRFDAIPMIALTTQSDDQSRQRGLAIGFDDYVTKINKIALHQRVEEYLGKAKH